MSATPTGLQARTENTVKDLSQQIVREKSMPSTRARIKTCIEIKHFCLLSNYGVGGTEKIN